LIAVGGTPLYYKALFEGLFSGPSAQKEVRARLASLSNEQLHRRLTEVDPQAAQRIHLRDSKRLVRALEVYELTGQPISALQSQWNSSLPRHPALWIGLNWERDLLNLRINARVKAMLQAGWLEETRSLIAGGAALSPSAIQAAGYAQLIEHLAGRLPLEEAVERIKMATRQLARRQIKWFRRFPQVHWLSGSAALQDNVQATLDLWRSGQDSELQPRP
jgi:tRNA dimethylallyltransferase